MILCSQKISSRDFLIDDDAWEKWNNFWSKVLQQVRVAKLT